MCTYKQKPQTKLQLFLVVIAKPSNLRHEEWVNVN